jgi:hypothetical protein
MIRLNGPGPGYGLSPPSVFLFDIARNSERTARLAISKLFNFYKIEAKKGR